MGAKLLCGHGAVDLAVILIQVISQSGHWDLVIHKVIFFKLKCAAGVRIKVTVGCCRQHNINTQ
uniref:Uncharacterized protein n=1 Tax=Anguilla anguilla TaxID=7936 RepID=A0A0E9W6N4_ANGAN